MPNVTVMVKPEHIERGVREDNKNCAIAKAFESLGINASISNYYANFYPFKKVGCAGYCLLPKIAKDFVKEFDKGRGEPFVCDIEVPIEAMPTDRK